MTRIVEKRIDGQGYHLHMIPSEKYKTNTLVIKFRAPITREAITNRALLPYVLQQATTKYPTARSLRTALDELYGAVLSVDASKKGEHHVVTFRMEIANDALISKQTNLLKEGVRMLHEIIFQPKVDNGGMDEAIIEREKQTLKQKIRALRDDKMSYANTRLLDEMCADEPYRLHVHGYEEDLPHVNGRSLYEYYQSMLEQDILDIYLLGDFDEQEVQTLVQSCFARKSRAATQYDLDVKKKAPSEPKEIIERQNVQQGKLHLGYRTNILFGDEDYYALQVFNGLFGGFPSSKLFMNVREKHSLAYYAASRFESHKGLLLVFSGIDPKDYQQAHDIILKQMEAMKRGQFTTEQLEETKNLIVNQLLETIDHQHGLIEVLYHQVLSDVDTTPEQTIEQIKKVTTDEVVQVANKIALDTTYFLTSEEGEDANA
ncbi:EF-P 5-aminopentanol modification-associated protein YfmF [Pontibacillus litoralis]|uniref:Zinc protease n=1 Tax=Pontibacillus litoralis JSM 072002 TaxID=1385512 RepID=A0A0A5G5H6_9BACI|nr:pitrilysin family protein [Pontibacillus litoralis]KGX88381.1 zinc protease [Pontibacillus litoralis JSM 072002]